MTGRRGRRTLSIVGERMYRPGLDGLRALAALAVFCFHGDLLWAHGGYLGVTVFFTLSGYLITSLLIGEHDTSATIDLRAFWRRRVHRILPLLAVVTTAWGTWGFIHGGQFGAQTVVGAVGTFTLCANWLAVADQNALGILGSTWSVMVEEQFYLVWPFVLIGLLRVRRYALPLVLAAAGVVMVHRYQLAGHGFARSWFATDTQADGLLLGAAVALGAANRSRLLAWLSGAVVLAALFGFDATDPNMRRFGMAAVAIATALLLPVLEQSALLAWKPLRALGKRSYGIYLWGCPIIYFAHWLVGLDGFMLAVVASTVTATVVEVTYRYVECPMRERGRYSRHAHHEEPTPVKRRRPRARPVLQLDRV